MSALTSFLEGTVRTATPLLLAALGELVTERAGVINIGIEGAMLAGAFAAMAGAAAGGAAAGYGLAIAAGVAMAALLALFVVALRADQIIAGTAITLLAGGATGTLYRTFYAPSAPALAIPTTGPVALPLLDRIPILGPALFDQPVVTYLAIAAVPIVWYVLYRTHVGLALRAVGENPAAAEAAGVAARRVRTMAILVGGAAAGLAGAVLVLAQAGTFVEGMSAGRGFIAIAIVALGRWRPWGVAAAALLFGAAMALQYFFQAMGWNVPYQIFLALPYVLTLLALAGLAGRAVAPEALGRQEEWTP